MGLDKKLCCDSIGIEGKNCMKYSPLFTLPYVTQTTIIGVKESKYKNKINANVFYLLFLLINARVYPGWPNNSLSQSKPVLNSCVLDPMPTSSASHYDDIHNQTYILVPQGFIANGWHLLKSQSRTIHTQQILLFFSSPQ